MKKKTKRRKLKDKLEKLTKELVRIRDKRTCQHCEKSNLQGSNCHVSHVIPRSASLRLMFDLLNLKVLCFHCHINWWHKNPVEAGDWFKKKFPKRWKYLEEKKKTTKPVMTYELEEWLQKLKEVE